MVSYLNVVDTIYFLIFKIKNILNVKYIELKYDAPLFNTY